MSVARGDQPGGQGLNGFVFNQLAAAGGNHHRIEYDETRTEFLQGSGYDFYDLHVIDHTDFYGLRIGCRS